MLNNNILTPEMIYFIEALKVEGCWSLKYSNWDIQNKNLPFIENIEKILKKNFKSQIFKKILVKIEPPDQNFNKKDIALKRNNENLKFHINNSPFSKTNKVITLIPYEKQVHLTLIVKNKSFPISIKPAKEEIQVITALKGWAYCDLKIYNKDLQKAVVAFIKKKELKVEPFLFSANKKYVAAAFSALIDAEGSLDYYRLMRRLRIRMRSPAYLQNWKELLKKFKVHAHFSQITQKDYALAISGWEDFNKLNAMGLELHQSKKVRKWRAILNSYKRNQVSRNTALNFYTHKLKEIGKPITAQALAAKLKKNKRVVNHYLTKLMRQNLLDVDKTKTAYLYSAKKIGVYENR